jgi:hypothetical protein
MAVGVGEGRMLAVGEAMAAGVEEGRALAVGSGVALAGEAGAGAPAFGVEQAVSTNAPTSSANNVRRSRAAMDLAAWIMRRLLSINAPVAGAVGMRWSGHIA